ncbi:MAG: ATP-binding protein [Roseiflexaceae bacterium]
MELLAFLLGVALIATLWWVRKLQQQLPALPAPLPPTSDPLRPLFDAATAAMDAGLVVVDRERTVRHINQQACELLGLETEPRAGNSLIGSVRDYQVDSLVSDVIKDGEPRELVLQPISYGRTLRLRAIHFSSPDLTGAVLTIRDVTQLNMLERARRDMVANVSHELRTPLASIKLLVETLQSEPPPPIAQRMLSQMAQEVDAVTQLVDELHQLSQIESGRVALQLTPAAFHVLVHRTVERIRPQTERKQLKIEPYVDPALPLVLMDADRIGQVLLNLLHNAAKFTPEGGLISIQAMLITVDPTTPTIGYLERRSREEAIEIADRRSASVSLTHQGRPELHIPQAHSPGDWLMISVSDTGIGIPSQDLPRIFERFYKVDRARTRNSGGTGLGLAIAKHLVEGHGGRIWATSREGHGSTFYFTLPVA